MITLNDIKDYEEALSLLHSRWVPHPAQIQIGRAALDPTKEIIFGQCGRKLGKSEIAIYLIYRHLLETKEAAAYYFAPFYKQAKEILWAPGRVKKLLPEVVSKVNDSEMRIFAGDRFIKLDGADNFDAGRGITPSLVILDEFKDFKPDFLKAMAPNLAARKAKLVIFGTPPEFENHFTEMADACKIDPNSVFFQFPTEANPHIDKKWLASEKARLIARGEEDVWEREYMANFVKGGKNSVFPMFSADKVVRPFGEVYNSIKKDLKKMRWFQAFDPGTTSIFAVLTGCLNPYTKEVFFLDEIYESEMRKTSVDQLWPRAYRQRMELLPGMHNWDDKWTLVYDEAAAWFQNAVMERYKVYIQPTKKASDSRMKKISLMRDMFLQHKIIISDRCKSFVWELERYIKDDKGRLPSANDHLVDCSVYALDSLYYSLNEAGEKMPDPLSERRAYKMSEEIKEEPLAPIDDFERDFNEQLAEEFSHDF